MDQDGSDTSGGSPPSPKVSPPLLRVAQVASISNLDGGYPAVVSKKLTTRLSQAIRAAWEAPASAPPEARLSSGSAIPPIPWYGVVNLDQVSASGKFPCP